MQRCVGVFFRSGESREQCRLSGARHSPERAHGKARAAQPLAAKSPRAGARAGQGQRLCTCQTKFGIT